MRSGTDLSAVHYKLTNVSNIMNVFSTTGTDDARMRMWYQGA